MKLLPNLRQNIFISQGVSRKLIGSCHVTMAGMSMQIFTWGLFFFSNVRTYDINCSKIVTGIDEKNGVQRGYQVPTDQKLKQA